MSDPFAALDKNFGFGFMRLPMLGEEVDIPQTKQMVDAFLAAGFRYFDTAHGYLGGRSELAIRECLASRYPRDSFILTDKLSIHYFAEEADIRPLFQKQLDACGVDYFDFYLMHALNASRIPHFRKTRAFEIVEELKKEGRIRHIGISFHDTADALEDILAEFPQIEVVQLQFNYVDYEDEKVQSRKCYEVCRRYSKPVIVMEPVKGGSLVDLPDSAQKVLDRLNGGSNASYAIRFAAGFEGIKMVLSGMSNLEQLEDNISFMQDFQPLSDVEQDAIRTVCAIYRNRNLIPCTGCRYCTEVCPQSIPIPELFTGLNARRREQEPLISGKAAANCIRCGRCEDICPQNLKLRELLTVAAEEL